MFPSTPIYDPSHEVVLVAEVGQQATLALVMHLGRKIPLPSSVIIITDGKPNPLPEKLPGREMVAIVASLRRQEPLLVVKDFDPEPPYRELEKRLRRR